MNFLAHIYLSGENDDLLKIGNFMADSVRGKQYLNYPESVQKGILLHRKIDEYTDNHPIFRISRKRLVPEFGHYSGVITDIFYDYFLAKNWKSYCSVSLDEYVQNFYQLIENKKEILNEYTVFLVSNMIQHNWLKSYETIEGIRKILHQMDSRTGFRSKMSSAHSILSQNELIFEKEFFVFFEQIQDFVKLNKP